MNRADSKHMSYVREPEHSSSRVKMAFHVTTSVHSVHKRTHLQKEKRGLTFPTYHMLSGFLCVHTPRLGVWNELSENCCGLVLLFHQPKDFELIPFILPVALNPAPSVSALPCRPSTCCLDVVYVRIHSINQLSTATAEHDISLLHQPHRGVVQRDDSPIQHTHTHYAPVKR